MNAIFLYIFEHPQIIIYFLAVFIFYLFYLIHRRGKKSSEATNWPVIGMMPAVFQYLHRAHDQVTQSLCECDGTHWFRGPWFCNRDMLITSDPTNIQHIFSKNFSNYAKGPEFRSKFEILGDGIFSADFGMWELQRRTTLSLTSHAKIFSNDSIGKTVGQKIENGLLPVLDYFAEKKTCVDLQEIFQRFTFDNICQLVLEYDPGSLSVDLPYIPCEKAFSTALQPLMHRLILPDSIWKLQKWMKIGNEKKLLEAWKAFDDFIYPLIKEEERRNMNILPAFRKAYEESNINFSGDLTQFLRDSLLGLLFAGRDTTSTCLTWLFWLIASNPLSESKILEEIERELMHAKQDNNYSCRIFNVEESSKLIYLHGALCESLRLYPPLALEYKCAVQSDTLPSGHYIHPNSKIIISYYTVGRMEAIWGKDCLEFKPERWISPRGGIKHEPSYKFPAFNVGPRTCLGKEMAFSQMKMVAATIIYNYQIKLVEGHQVVPLDSLMLHAKYGVRVLLSKRNI